MGDFFTRISSIILLEAILLSLLNDERTHRHGAL